VDDGSTDGGADVVRSVDEMPVKRGTQDNRGPGQARNRGAREADGALLAFLDADDEWMPAYLAHAVAMLTAHPEAAAVSAGYIEYPRRRSRALFWRPRGVAEGLFSLNDRTPAMEAVHRLAYMSPWSTVVRAEVFHRWGGFYARGRCLYAEDAYLWFKVLLNERVLFSLAPLVRFHREDSALSRNQKGARPIEPFLKEPEDILAAAPEQLRGLARRMLGIRAAKTACMYGFWGRWREAAALMRRHFTLNALFTPYGVPALACSTPAAALIGGVARPCLRLGGRLMNLIENGIGARFTRGDYGDDRGRQPAAR